MVKQKQISKNHQINLEDIFSQIDILLDTLFNFRLIDKISRPIEPDKRETITIQYKKHFDQLHSKLSIVRRANEKKLVEVDGTSQKRFQERSTVIHRPIDYKNQIRKIESKYIQILKQGSFKHYYKVSNAFQLPIFMPIINIEFWATMSLRSDKSTTSCC